VARFLQYALFLGIVIAILVGSHLYFYVRLVRDPALPDPWRQVAIWALVVLGVSVPGVFLLNRVIPPGASRVVLFVPYLWIGVMLLLAFFLVCADILKVLAFAGLKVSGQGEFFEVAGRRVLRNRIVAGAVVATTMILTVVAVRTAFLAPVVRKVRVELDRLPPQLTGFTIVHLTDLHLGSILAGPFLEDVVERTNALEPDLVVITGDLVDAPVDTLLPVLEPFRNLRPPHGVFFVTGNHELYSGPDEWLPAIESLGVKVLGNERVGIERDGAGFDLAGVHDDELARHAKGLAPSLARALEGRDPSRELVLLAHRAHTVHHAEKMGVGLQLSGHNHGGQIWPWMYAVGLQQPYVSGLHQHGKTAIYVSDGTGFWGPPMRLGTRSEIAHITLVATQP
jgi:predicted MPP superfamily phosphohydrolase